MQPETAMASIPWTFPQRAVAIVLVSDPETEMQARVESLRHRFGLARTPDIKWIEGYRISLSLRSRFAEPLLWKHSFALPAGNPRAPWPRSGVFRHCKKL
jgi:hypothetical protein